MLETTRAQRWQLRAAEVRQAAAIMDDRKTQEALARVARIYDALARQAEELGTEAPVPALRGNAIPV